MKTKMKLKLFPWTKAAHTKLYSTFGLTEDVALEEALSYLLECAKSEMKIIFQNSNYERAEKLMFVLKDYVLFLHMQKILEKEALEFGKSLYLKVLSCIVDLYIVLAQGDCSSTYLENACQDICIYCGNKCVYKWNVLLHCSLLKKIHSEVCCPLLRCLLRVMPENILEPKAYMKFILLSRLWKVFTADKTEKVSVVKLASEVKVPPSFIQFLTVLPVSGALNVFANIKEEKLAKYLICKKFPKEMLQEIKLVLCEEGYVSPSNSTASSPRPTLFENQKPLFVIDDTSFSTLSETNINHDDGDIENEILDMTGLQTESMSNTIHLKSNNAKLYDGISNVFDSDVEVTSETLSACVDDQEKRSIKKKQAKKTKNKSFEEDNVPDLLLLVDENLSLNVKKPTAVQKPTTGTAFEDGKEHLEAMNIGTKERGISKNSKCSEDVACFPTLENADGTVNDEVLKVSDEKLLSTIELHTVKKRKKIKISESKKCLISYNVYENTSSNASCDLNVVKNSNEEQAVKSKRDSGVSVDTVTPKVNSNVTDSKGTVGICDALSKNNILKINVEKPMSDVETHVGKNRKKSRVRESKECFVSFNVCENPSSNVSCDLSVVGNGNEEQAVKSKRESGAAIDIVTPKVNSNWTDRKETVCIYDSSPKNDMLQQINDDKSMLDTEISAIKKRKKSKMRESKSCSISYNVRENLSSNVSCDLNVEENNNKEQVVKSKRGSGAAVDIVTPKVNSNLNGTKETDSIYDALPKNDILHKIIDEKSMSDTVIHAVKKRKKSKVGESKKCFISYNVCENQSSNVSRDFNVIENDNEEQGIKSKTCNEVLIDIVTQVNSNLNDGKETVGIFDASPKNDTLKINYKKLISDMHAVKKRKKSKVGESEKSLISYNVYENPSSNACDFYLVENNNDEQAIESKRDGRVAVDIVTLKTNLTESKEAVGICDALPKNGIVQKVSNEKSMSDMEMYAIKKRKKSNVRASENCSVSYNVCENPSSKPSCDLNVMENRNEEQAVKSKRGSGAAVDIVTLEVNYNLNDRKETVDICESSPENDILEINDEKVMSDMQMHAVKKRKKSKASEAKKCFISYSVYENPAGNASYDFDVIEKSNEEQDIKKDGAAIDIVAVNSNLNDSKETIGICDASPKFHCFNGLNAECEDSSIRSSPKLFDRYKCENETSVLSHTEMKTISSKELSVEANAHCRASLKDYNTTFNGSAFIAANEILGSSPREGITEQKEDLTSASDGLDKQCSYTSPTKVTDRNIPTVVIQVLLRDSEVVANRNKPQTQNDVDTAYKGVPTPAVTMPASEMYSGGSYGGESVKAETISLVSKDVSIEKNNKFNKKQKKRSNDMSGSEEYHSSVKASSDLSVFIQKISSEVKEINYNNDENDIHLNLTSATESPKVNASLNKAECNEDLCNTEITNGNTAKNSILSPRSPSEIKNVNYRKFNTVCSSQNDYKTPVNSIAMENHALRVGNSPLNSACGLFKHSSSEETDRDIGVASLSKRHNSPISELSIVTVRMEKCNLQSPSHKLSKEGNTVSPIKPLHMQEPYSKSSFRVKDTKKAVELSKVDSSSEFHSPDTSDCETSETVTGASPRLILLDCKERCNSSEQQDLMAAQQSLTLAIDSTLSEVKKSEIRQSIKRKENSKDSSSNKYSTSDLPTDVKTFDQSDKSDTCMLDNILLQTAKGIEQTMVKSPLKAEKEDCTKPENKEGDKQTKKWSRAITRQRKAPSKLLDDKCIVLNKSTCKVPSEKDQSKTGNSKYKLKTPEKGDPKGYNLRRRKK